MKQKRFENIIFSLNHMDFRKLNNFKIVFINSKKQDIQANNIVERIFKNMQILKLKAQFFY